MSSEHKASGVVSGDVRSRKSKALYWGTRGVLAAAVIVAIVVTVWLVVIKDKSPTPMPTDTYTSSLQDAERLGATGDYAKEAQALEAILVSDLSDAQRKTVMAKLAASYTNGLQVDKAIGAHNNLLNRYPDEALTAKRGLALLYMRYGESGKNVEYLQKSVGYFEEVIQIEKSDDQYKFLLPTDDSNLRYAKKLLEVK